MTAYSFSSIPRRASSECKAEALKELANGRSLLEVGELFGVKVATLKLWVKKATTCASTQPDKKVRLPAPDPTKGVKYSSAIRREVLDYLNQGKSAREVAKVTGMSVSSVYNVQYAAQARALRKNLHEPNPTTAFRDKVIQLKTSNKKPARIAQLLAIPLPWVLAWLADPPQPGSQCKPLSRA